MEPIDLRIKCVFDSEDGTFGGILFGKDGAKIGPVTGEITPSLLTKKQKKKPGRKAAPQRDVAIYAHVVMALNTLEFQSLGKAQNYVATKLAIGDKDKPELQIRSVQRNCSKAKDVLPSKGLEFFHWVPPGTDISSAVWMFFEIGTDIEVSDRMPDGKATLSLNGRGWLCNWNDRKAKYGTVTLKMNGQSDEHIRRVTEILST